MAQFQPFDYGRAIGQGTTNALNTMQAQDYARNRANRNILSDTRTQQAVGNQEVEQTKRLAMATTQALRTPNIIPKLWPSLQKKGLIPQDMQIQGLSQEQIVSTLQNINDGAMQALQAYGGGQQNKIGTYNPRDYTEGSLAKFRQSGNTSDLVRYVAPRLETIGGVASEVTLGSERGVRPLSDLPTEVSAVRQLKGGAAQGVADVELATKPEIEKRIALGKADAKKVEQAFTSLDKITVNIGNLREAAALVKAGAATGAIMSRLPSLRANAVALDSIQGRLALDVVGAVTFGALSQGELDLAKDVAMPIKLKGARLIKWLEDRISAQEKVSNYLEKQAVFLSNGGSRAEWVEEAKNIYGGGGQQSSSIDDLVNQYAD